MKIIFQFILFVCLSNMIKAQDTLSIRSDENILVKVIEVGTSEDSSNMIKAQDTLSMRSGENMLVKVIEVGTSEVKYRKLDNLNGPVFSILKSDLLMIKYENGTKDDFSKEERALIKVKKRHTVRNIGIVYGVLGVGVLIALGSVGGFRSGGFFGL